MMLTIFKVKFSRNSPRFKKYLMEKIEILIILKKMMMMAVIWKGPLTQLMVMNETLSTAS
jgi:hypothetical protein